MNEKSIVFTKEQANQRLEHMVHSHIKMLQRKGSEYGGTQILTYEWADEPMSSDVIIEFVDGHTIRIISS